MDIIQQIRDRQATIIDVRTPEEFEEGHVEGSINIPLNEVPQRVDEIRALATPVILCCRSGARSEQATGYLRHMGLADCHNGGSWWEVQDIRNS